MIFQVESKPDEFGGKTYWLLIDSTRFDAAEIHGVPGEIILRLQNELAEKTLLSCQLTDIPNEIDAVTMRPSLVALPHLFGIRLDLRPYHLRFEFFVNAETWKGQWSLGEYVQALKGEVAHYRALTFQTGANLAEEGFGINCIEVADETSIWHNVIRSSTLIREIHLDAERQLRARSHDDVVIIRLGFPPAVRVACEQYLLYFAQFLLDIGVSATTELRHEAGEVLFSVRPDDSHEALANIRDALAIYLSLPSSPLITVDDDIRSQRLIANVDHLKSQLMLAKATIVAQERALRAQDYALELQEQLTGIGSTQPGNDRENLLGGALTLKPLEGKGFDLNLPHIWRYLRERFGRD